MEKDSYVTGRDLTEAEVFARKVDEAGQMAEAKVPYRNEGGGGSPISGHSVDQCSTRGCDTTPTVGTADQEVRYLIQKLVNLKETRIELAQQEAIEAHYFRALFDALPTKMSHDAAMGLKLLVRSYGNSPLRY